MAILTDGLSPTRPLDVNFFVVVLVAKDAEDCVLIDGVDVVRGGEAIGAVTCLFLEDEFGAVPLIILLSYFEMKVPGRIDPDGLIRAAEVVRSWSYFGLRAILDEPGISCKLDVFLKLLHIFIGNLFRPGSKSSG